MTNPASPGEAPLIDSHCHLYSFYEEASRLVADAARAGVTRVITIGTDVPSSEAAVALAAAHPGVYAAVGVHPHVADRTTEADLARIAELARKDKVVAYGEIGLDYALMHSSVEGQKRLFARQLELAKDLQLPVIIHDREAHADTATLIRAASPLPRGGVMHCFSGDLDFAREMLDLGFLLSFSGVLTFKNAETLQEVAREIDLRHFMVETDAPYLAPVPFRGKRNQPAYVVHTAQKLADLKDLPLEEVARQTTANACRFFRLPEAAA